VAEVVEGDHLVEVHEEEVGEPELVPVRDRHAGLEALHRVVGDVADQAAGEGRSARHADGAVGGERVPDPGDGIAGVAELPAEDAPGPGAEEGEPGAPLAALDRLEEEGAVFAAGELQERRDRRLGVRVDLDADRDRPAGLAQREEGL
jgi:hypothetical protein